MADQLFCYGTLRAPEVMRRVIGLLPDSLAGVLMDYACYSLVDVVYPGIVPEQHAQVAGVLYQGLNDALLAKLDAFEGEEYERERVWIDVATGERIQAWTYILQPRYYHCRAERGWSLERFLRDHLAQYLRQC